MIQDSNFVALDFSDVLRNCVLIDMFLFFCTCISVLLFGITVVSFFVVFVGFFIKFFLMKRGNLKKTKTFCFLCRLEEDELIIIRICKNL